MKTQSTSRLRADTEQTALSLGASDDVVFDKSSISGSQVLLKALTSPWWQSRILFLYDVLIASLSLMSGFWFTPHHAYDSSGSLSIRYMLPIFSGGFVVASLMVGLYDKKCIQAPLASILGSPFAAAGAWIVLLLSNYFFTYSPIGRWIAIISWLSLTLAAPLLRILFHFVHRHSPTNIVLIGDDEGYELIRTAAENFGNSTLRVVKTVKGQGCSGISTSGHLELLAANSKADVIVVQDGCRTELLEQAVECVRKGIWVSDYIWYFESAFEKVPVEKINLNWLISAHLRLLSPLGSCLKRLSDLTLAAIGLVLTAPLWPLIALAVKITSPGPVFYLQERVGRNGTNFILLKFRTMRNGAENGKPVWAQQGDNRVTLVGRFLRKSRLDEIPQFINVLKGDMAFIGPRPERPEFVEILASKIPHYKLRHLVKPGITGWAQIMYPYGASEQDALEKLRYDLYYVKYGDLTLDLRILIRTVGAMMKGAR